MLFTRLVGLLIAFMLLNFVAFVAPLRDICRFQGMIISNVQSEPDPKYGYGSAVQIHR